MMPHMYSAQPFAGLVFMIVVWLVQVLIAFLIYRDAREKKMLAPVWGILAILPMFGYLVDVLYLIIREIWHSQKTDTPPVSP